MIGYFSRFSRRAAVLSSFAIASSFLYYKTPLFAQMKAMSPFNTSMMAECQGTTSDYRHPNVTVLSHPIVPYLMSQLRNPSQSPVGFRKFSDRIMRLLLEEALSQEPMKVSRVKALTGDIYDHYEFENKPNDYCVLPIIRAGDSMLKEAFEVMPGVPVAKILIQRDESTPDKRPIYFYDKFPKSIAKKHRVFILDPMLGTGGSVCCCINRLKDHGVEEDRIVFINLISCPEGLERVTREHPGVKIITGAIDPGMNEDTYIAPGLGDFGDRYFNSN